MNDTRHQFTLHHDPDNRRVFIQEGLSPDDFAVIHHDGSKRGSDAALARAERIVAALNSHAAMVEACRWALGALECNPEFRKNEPTIAKLRAALAIAEVKP